MRSHWTAALLVATLVPARAWAQDLAPETRVRVFTPDTDEEDGEKGDHLTADGTTVSIRRRDRVIEFARSKVIRVERFAGRKTGRKGLAIGLVIGAGTGLLAGATYWVATLKCDPAQSTFDPWAVCRATPESDRRGRNGFIGATAGFTVLGALIGRRVHHDTWVEVPLGKVALGVGPNGPTGGVGLATSVRF